MRTFLLMASLAAPAIFATFGAPASAAGLHAEACAPGYHAGRHGNCQPNVREVNRYCPPGSVYAPFPDGWVCNPAPREAY